MFKCKVRKEYLIKKILKVSVVCPFFNEEDIITASIKRMYRNLDNQFEDWELILVNDGSKDNSFKEAKYVSKELSEKIKVISCHRNQGRGRALKNGINFAVGDIIVTTEADCSWGDNIAKRLVDYLLINDLDVVVASPHAKKGKFINVPLKRVLITKIGNFLINIFFSSGVSMNTGMTRAYKKEVIQPLVCFENGKEFHLEVLLKLKTLNFRIDEIPAVLEWKDHKLSKTSKKKSRKSSTNLLKTIYTHFRFLAIAQPRMNFTLASLFTSGIGFLVLIWAFRNLITGNPSLFLAILSLQLLLFSLIFIGFAVLFDQFREVLREKWMNYYKGKKPPSALNAQE